MWSGHVLITYQAWAVRLMAVVYGRFRNTGISVLLRTDRQRVVMEVR